MTMARKSVSNAIYFQCFTFTITALLAASNVEGADGGTRVARSAFDSVCYNSKQQKVKCSKKKGIIIGIVVASLFVLLGALYLYGKWAGRRKRSTSREEHEPLSTTDPDCEKGISGANKNKNINDDDEDPDKFEGTSSYETSSIHSVPRVITHP